MGNVLDTYRRPFYTSQHKTCPRNILLVAPLAFLVPAISAPLQSPMENNKFSPNQADQVNATEITVDSIGAVKIREREREKIIKITIITMNKGGKRKRDGKWKEVNESECWNLWSVVNVFTGETYSYSHARLRINFQERTAARVNHPCGATEWNTPSPRSPGQSKRVEFKLSTLNYPLSRSSRKDLFPGSLSNPFDRSISSITTNFLIFNLDRCFHLTNFLSI